MLKKVAVIMWHDRATNPFRIFAKSYHRYRRYGWKIVKKRLNEEYRALYPNEICGKHAQKLYTEWIAQNEKNTHYSSDSFDYKPLISIITPVYKTDYRFLREMIESVISQSYENWQLCIADDASNDRELEKILKEYSSKEPRIETIFRDKNGHISEACNTALNIAKGEYIVLLDHDDTLAPNALEELVKALNNNRNLKLIYSDEDKIDTKGRRYSPHFKSDWNRDLFYSQNYIAHMTALHKETVDRVGGFRKGFEGSQDYDLLLRVIKYIDDSEICHIDKILYHWRAVKGSTAYSAKEKSYTTMAGLRALVDHFRDAEGTVVTKGMLPNTYKVEYPIIPKEPLVSVVIPTRDGYEYLHKCIESIYEKTYYKRFEIILVDNQSRDEKTLEYISEISEKYDNLKVFKFDEPFNYSKINNFAVKHAEGEVLLFLNDDIEIISPNWMTEMVQHAIREDIGAVGAKLYYDNETIQHAGVILGIGGVAGHSHKYFSRDSHGYFSKLKLIQNYSAVTGACMALKKSIFLEVGGFDEENLAVAFNDVDLCLKIEEAGYRNLWTPYAEAYHHESVSRGAENTAEKVKRFNSEIAFMKRKWGEKLKRDRYYSRHLTTEHEDFSISR